MTFPSTLLPQTNDPKEIQKGLLDLLSKLNQLAVPIANTAAWFVRFNPTPLAGQFCFETDTLSFKVGDGRTAYETLTYFYRGLPVAGEPSLGTSHNTDADDSTYLVTNSSPGAGTWQTCTFTVAAGTKAVVCTVVINSMGGEFLRWRKIGSAATWTNSQRRTLVGTNVNATVMCQAMIPVNSSGQVQFAISGAGSSFSIGFPQFYLT